VNKYLKSKKIRKYPKTKKAFLSHRLRMLEKRPTTTTATHRTKKKSYYAGDVSQA
jgi:hypothetical protein